MRPNPAEEDLNRRKRKQYYMKKVFDDMKQHSLRRIACTLCLSLSLTLPALAAGTYSDVPEGAWYAPAVEAVTREGLMGGVGSGRFAPTAQVTRATVAATLWRMEDSPAPTAASGFTDVDGEAWYAQAVDWAYQEGIAAGDGKGLFRPENPVTREQLAVFVYHYGRYRGEKPAEGVLELYTDASSVHAWAKEGMEHAVGAGLIQGSGYRLDPQGTASRAQLAVLLERLTTPVMG